MTYYLQLLKDLFLRLIGDYVPLSYVDPDTGATVYLEGVASIDWPWLASAAFVLIMVYWLGRIIATAITGRRR